MSQFEARLYAFILFSIKIHLNFSSMFVNTSQCCSFFGAISKVELYHFAVTEKELASRETANSRAYKLTYRQCRVAAGAEWAEKKKISFDFVCDFWILWNSSFFFCFRLLFFDVVVGNSYTLAHATKPSIHREMCILLYCQFGSSFHVFNACQERKKIEEEEDDVDVDVEMESNKYRKRHSFLYCLEFG